MQESSGAPGKLQHWRFLFDEVVRKTRNPIQHPTFVIYFIVAVVGIGAWGLWTEIIANFFPKGRGILGFQDVFITYIPAFVAPTCMQLILAEKQKTLRAFSIFLTALCLVSFALCVKISSWPSMAFGVVSTLGALWLWWIANSDQSDFTDGRVDLDAATGGEVSPDVPLAGSLADFKS